MSGAPNPTGGGAQKTPDPAKSAGFFQMQPITNQSKQKYINLLAYGQAGAGKSTLAGSACNIDEASDVLLVTAEGGDLVFDKNPRILRPELIDMVRITRIEQLQKVYQWLVNHIRARDTNDEAKLRTLQDIILNPEDPASKRIRRFHTVILDSLTDIEAQNMNHVLGIADKGFEIGDDLSPAGYGEFRKNNNTIQQIVRSFRDLNLHLIAICGQRWMQDEQKRFHYTPWMTGQLATQIQSFFDVVGYMAVSQTDPTKDPVRRLFVQPQVTTKFDAKCRIASLRKPFLEDPTFSDLLQEAGYLKTAPENN